MVKQKLKARILHDFASHPEGRVTRWFRYTAECGHLFDDGKWHAVGAPTDGAEAEIVECTKCDGAEMKELPKEEVDEALRTLDAAVALKPHGPSTRNQNCEGYPRCARCQATIALKELAEALGSGQ